VRERNQAFIAQHAAPEGAPHFSTYGTPFDYAQGRL
jgi:hypothetical protein